MMLIFIHSEHLNGFILPLPFRGDQTGIWGRSAILTDYNVLLLQIIQTFVSFYQPNKSYLLTDKLLKLRPPPKKSLSNNPTPQKIIIFYIYITRWEDDVSKDIQKLETGRPSYAFFWVIPRRLEIICWRFGTFCLFHLHRQVDMRTHI
jgi:hypothetical protein